MTQGIDYVVMRCPACGSRDIRVSSSPRAAPGRPRKRQHNCCACGARFPSVEAPDRA
jgi:transcriptional regulator NrdR family protein